jgi:CPA2 family monovalent cation:H+ antiporter-2
VLVQAHIAEAGLLVVAASDSTDVRPIIATARALNPGIPVVVRASSADEAELLRSDGASKAVDATTAMASVMVREVLDLVAVEQRPVAAAAS